MLEFPRKKNLIPVIQIFYGNSCALNNKIEYEHD
jgi:hypothetical protein